MTQKVSTNCLLFYPRTELCFSYSKVCSRRCWFCNLKEVITELNAFWSAIFLFSSFTCKQHIHFCLLLQNIIFFSFKNFHPHPTTTKKMVCPSSLFVLSGNTLYLLQTVMKLVTYLDLCFSVNFL